MKEGGEVDANSEAEEGRGRMLAAENGRRLERLPLWWHAGAKRA